MTKRLRPNPPGKIRRCRVCNEPVKSTYKNQLYCSKKCVDTPKNRKSKGAE